MLPVSASFFFDARPIPVMQDKLVPHDAQTAKQKENQTMLAALQQALIANPTNSVRLQVQGEATIVGHVPWVCTVFVFIWGLQTETHLY